MTKKRLTPQQQLRKEIDAIATLIVNRADDMIQQDIPVVLAYHLAISFELEQEHYRNALALLTKSLN